MRSLFRNARESGRFSERAPCVNKGSIAQKAGMFSPRYRWKKIYGSMDNQGLMLSCGSCRYTNILWDWDDDTFLTDNPHP